MGDADSGHAGLESSWKTMAKTLNGTPGNDVFNETTPPGRTPAEDEVIYGLRGKYTIGGDDDDTLYGDDDDTLDGGADVARGGNGNDTLIAKSRHAGRHAVICQPIAPLKAGSCAPSETARSPFPSLEAAGGFGSSAPASKRRG